MHDKNYFKNKMNKFNFIFLKSKKKIYILLLLILNYN